MILYLHCRRRCWRQGIRRGGKPNLRERGGLATQVALKPHGMDVRLSRTSIADEMREEHRRQVLDK
jgi:hypothetical protein